MEQNLRYFYMLFFGIKAEKTKKNVKILSSIQNRLLASNQLWVTLIDIAHRETYTYIMTLGVSAGVASGILFSRSFQTRTLVCFMS